MRNLTSHLPTAARLGLGLVFLVFGLNGFLHFLPQPPLPERALPYLGGLASAGYFFPVLKGTEVLAGLALLSGRFVPLALTVLAPIVVQITLFHVLLAPGGFGLVAFVLASEIYLAWAYRDAFRGVLQSDAKPARQEVRGRAIAAPAE